MPELKEIVVEVQMDGNTSIIDPATGYLALRENMDFLTAQATINFRDYIALLSDIYPIMQDTKIDILIADEEIERSISFYPFSYAKKQEERSVQPTYTYNLDLISKYSYPLLSGSEFHSDRMKASDYVKYLAGKLGLDYDVEETKDVNIWINPNWKYSQMLRYLATRSISLSGSSGYVYYVTAEGVLTFKSLDKLFDEGVEEIIGVTLTEGEGAFNNILVKGNLFGNVLLGSNNVKASWYDFTASQIVEEETKYGAALKKRGIQKGIAHSLAEVGNKKYYGAMYTDVESRPKNVDTGVFKRTLLQSEWLQCDIITGVDLERRIGGVINLQLPANYQMQGGEMNFNFSGRWLIKGMMTYGHGDYYQKLQLIRPGINLDDVRGEGYY